MAKYGEMTRIALRVEDLPKFFMQMNIFMWWVEYYIYNKITAIHMVLNNLK